MKKILKVSTIVLLCAIFVILMVACEHNNGKKEATLLLVDEDGMCITAITKTTQSEYLSGFMDELSVDGFSYTISGTFVESFCFNDVTYGDVNNGKYVLFYTTLTDISYITPGFTKTIDGVVYNSCGYGVNQMPIEDGATYVICVEVF